MQKESNMELEVIEESSNTLKKVDVIGETKKKITNEYSQVHSGPYIVVVQGRQGNVSQIHPMKLGKILYEKGGYNINNIKKIGKNKLEIKFNSFVDANKFVGSDLSNKYDLSIYIPSYYTQIVGIIRGVDLELSNEEIKEQIRTEEKYEVLDVFRFSRKHFSEQGEVKYIPTQTVKVTFKAQNLPKRVYLYFTTSEVEPFRVPILQCRKCQRFGHFSKYCTNEAVCLVCAGKHSSAECNSKNIKCINCSLPHKANSAVCALYKTQEQIRKKMDEFKLSYREARDMLQGKITYAQLVAEKQNSTNTVVMGLQRQDYNSMQTWSTGNMANKRKIVEPINTQKRKELQSQMNEIINNPHGRLSRTVKPVTAEPALIYNKKQEEKSRKIELSESNSLQGSKSKKILFQQADNPALQRLNNILLEVPDYLRQEMEQLKMEIVLMARSQKI